jgi:hypothetical protein
MPTLRPARPTSALGKVASGVGCRYDIDVTEQNGLTVLGLASTLAQASSAIFSDEFRRHGVGIHLAMTAINL